MKKKRLPIKPIKLFLLLTAAVSVFIITVNTIICNSVKESIVDADSAYPGEADCILILGAGVRDDGTPSNMLEDRILTGVELYNKSGVKLLMSGDHGRGDYDEVNCMKDYAMSLEVPAEDIFMDHAGFSTYESLFRAKEIFGAEKLVIVTQKYHLYRALYIAKSLGIEAVGIPSDLRTYYGQSMRETREFAARVKDFIYTVIKPNPKYLGEAISLKGSGEVTNG